jgi:hypothetical protein
MRYLIILLGCGYKAALCFLKSVSFLKFNKDIQRRCCTRSYKLALVPLMMLQQNTQDQEKGKIPVLLFFWQIKKNAVIFDKLKLQIMTLTANRQPPTANRP